MLYEKASAVFFLPKHFFNFHACVSQKLFFDRFVVLGPWTFHRHIGPCFLLHTNGQIVLSGLWDTLMGEVNSCQKMKYNPTHWALCWLLVIISSSISVHYSLKYFYICWHLNQNCCKILRYYSFGLLSLYLVDFTRFYQS